MLNGLEIAVVATLVAPRTSLAIREGARRISLTTSSPKAPTDDRCSGAGGVRSGLFGVGSGRRLCRSVIIWIEVRRCGQADAS